MASQLTVIDSAESKPEQPQCPNCGERMEGEYCHSCGQKKLDRRELSLKRFFINATNEFTDLESNKAVQTFKALLFSPVI
jgi:tRNA(Ile2) C34 agmatinyltransferase TiaS